jgi:hypothetical protein
MLRDRCRDSDRNLAETMMRGDVPIVTSLSLSLSLLITLVL